MNLAMIIAVACALAQAEPTDAVRAKEVELWRKSLDALAKEHLLAAGNRPTQPFRLNERPVFLWNQPVRAGQIGSVYLWLQPDGRPAAIGTLFCWRIGQQPLWAIAHEFHSLADAPLKLDFRGAEVWAPAVPGLVWKPLPVDTSVAESRPKQLSQIRQLAQQFSAHTVTANNDRWQLRLLSRPLYEYTAQADPPIRAGAVLAFCQDMDPELILLLEPRPVQGRVAWHYACAVFTDYALHVHYRDQEIWTAPATPGVTHAADKPYWREYITRQAQLPEEPEPAATREK